MSCTGRLAVFCTYLEQTGPSASARASAREHNTCTAKRRSAGPTHTARVQPREQTLDIGVLPLCCGSLVSNQLNRTLLLLRHQQKQGGREGGRKEGREEGRKGEREGGREGERDRWRGRERARESERDDRCDPLLDAKALLRVLCELLDGSDISRCPPRRHQPLSCSLARARERFHSLSLSLSLSERERARESERGARARAIESELRRQQLLPARSRVYARSKRRQPCGRALGALLCDFACCECRSRCALFCLAGCTT